MKQALTVAFFLALFSQEVVATRVSGKITDENNQPVPFASVYVKGTTHGTTSNIQGFYSIDLAPGSYEIVFKLIGYRPDVEKVDPAATNLEINVKLVPESVQLREATINGDAEDPAYAVIRQAQKKRKYYLDQVDAYSCDVYIKGVQRITKKPKKIMGVELDAEGDIDTVTGIVYLSESVSKFNFKQPGKIREEMVSSKVSGDNKAFSYNQASDMLFNFYENLLQVEGLSERGFISPISHNAMLSYKYRMIGTFFEDGQMINKIEVIPKRKNDPVFRGVIDIMDGSWRIHSLQLILTKDAQIDFVDTLRINQVFLPVEKDIWLPFSNKFMFDFGVLGIKGSGMFVGVNANYVIDPDFPKHFFTNEIMKVSDDANKKDSAYWKQSRPIPLTLEEENDYRKRDSLFRIRNSKSYMDSLDRKENKFRFKDLFLGYSYGNRFKKQYFTIAGPLEGIQFNTVQGFNLGTRLNFSKYFDENRNYSFGVSGGYGFSNKDAYWKAYGNYYYKPQKFASLSFACGKQYEQFNSYDPILPIINSLYSLLNEQNFMKLYLKYYAKVTHSSELFNGFYLSPALEYADRLALVNTTDYSLVKSKNEYTSNDPRDTAVHNYSFGNNQALTLGINIRYVIKQKYYTMPRVKYVTGSKFPVLLLSYKKGLHALGSDVDYDLITLGLEHKLNFKLFGNATYSFTVGRFVNNKKMYFMDWYHFNGNQTLFSNFALQDFQVLGYYSNSTNKQFMEAHYEHNFGGFFLNKLPLIKKLKLQEVGKLSLLTNDGKNQYVEVSVGLKRLGFRADFVTGFSNQKKVSSGIRIGVKFN
jgi:hypothetical protein